MMRRPARFAHARTRSLQAPKRSAWIAQARFDAASNTADEAEKKAAQVEAGRARKKTPYESDSLFMYLWRRKLGTPDYSSGFFVR
jgi:hypothetical protein